METMRSVHPRPRLAAAVEMLSGYDTVADIGCDHGRLSCALIQQGAAQRCIAVDISAPSLLKAKRLAESIGIADRVQTRLGDGFLPLTEGEADAAALLGMGGTLMTRLLDACPVPLMGARLCVFQPMRAVEDIRRYLYEGGWRVIDDRTVLQSGRLYQVFAATPPESGRQALPDGWPADWFSLGYTAFARRDPLTRRLAEELLARRRRQLARTHAPALISECERLEQLLHIWEDTICS